MLRWPLFCLLLILWMFPSLLVAGDELARVDRYGDPLPPLALARLGTVRFRHADQIRCLEYSPDGKLLASGGDDNRLYLWEAQTGRKIREFAGHPGRVVWLAFSPDGKTLVSACANYFSGDKEHSEGCIRLWNVATGNLIFQLPKVDEETEIVAFAPDGKMFASGHPSGRARLWDAATGKLLHELAEECDKERVVALTFAANGRNLVVADENGTTRVWDVSTEKTLREEKYLEKPRRFAFSPDGKVFATADGDEIRLFCVATLKETFRFQTQRQPNSSMTFTPDNKTLVSSGTDTIHFWDVNSGKHLRQFPEQNKYGNPSLVRISPDGKTIATAEAEESRGVIQLWDARTGAPRSTREGHHNRVNQVAFLRDGNSVVSEGWRQLAVWTQGTGNDFCALKLPPATFAFSLPGPDRSSLLVTTFREELLLMEIPSGREISRFSLGTNGQPIAVSTEAKRAAVVKYLDRDSQLQEVWDLKTKKVIWSKITDSSNWNYGLVECSPDLRLAAIVDSSDFFYRNKLRVEDIDTGKCLFTWEFHDKRNQGPKGLECRETIDYLKFSLDGRMLVAHCSDSTHRLLEIATGQERLRLQGPDCKSLACAFAPDGRTLATGHRDGTVRLWDLRNGKELKVFSGHLGEVHSVDFSADGCRLVSGSSDTTALVWEIPDTCRGPGLGALKLGREEQAILWDKMMGRDTAKAYAAQQRLITSPGEAVSVCRMRLVVEQTCTSEQIQRWILQLDDEEFTVREEASANLERVEGDAENLLEKTLQGTCSLETRRRIVILLETLKAKRLPTRVVRAVELLEQVGTADAVEVLQGWEKKAADNRIREEVRRSLGRLAAKRKAP